MASGIIPKRFGHISQFNLMTQTTLTSTNTSYNTYSGRKFSDADWYIFICRAGANDIRSTMTVSKYHWGSGVSLTFDMNHGSGGSSIAFVTVSYNSDTSVKAYTSGSSGIKILEIVGIKFQ